jgi:hypothetical protein
MNCLLRNSTEARGVSGMVMMIAKNAEAEVIRLGDVDVTIASKISFGIL